MPKDKETTTFGLSSKKLARLFAMGSEQHEPVGTTDDEQEMADLLQDYLRESMPFASEDAPDRRPRVGNLRYTINALAGEPIGELLCDPKTDIGLIRRIKDYGRKRSTSAKSKPEHHIANTIYYAAIAHALVYHSTKVTTHSRADLSRSFAQLASEHWIPETLAELFAGAERACRGEADPQD